MTTPIHSLISSAENLLALEPEELAGVLLEHLNSLDDHSKSQLNRRNFVTPSNFNDYPADSRDRIARAIMEAWVWLEREGLIAPKPGSDDAWRFITRRGERLSNTLNVRAYRQAHRRQLNGVNET